MEEPTSREAVYAIRAHVLACLNNRLRDAAGITEALFPGDEKSGQAFLKQIRTTL